MKRRNFFNKLGIAIPLVAITPTVLSAFPEVKPIPPTLYQGTMTVDDVTIYESLKSYLNNKGYLVQQPLKFTEFQIVKRRLKTNYNPEFAQYSHTFGQMQKKYAYQIIKQWGDEIINLWPDVNLDGKLQLIKVFKTPLVYSPLTFDAHHGLILHYIKSDFRG